MSDAILGSIDWSKPSSAAPAVMDFLDCALRPQADFSLREEFPALYGAWPGGHSLYLSRGGKVIAHVAYLAREFRHPEFNLPVGLIGSVVTSPEHRGRGHASHLLSLAVDRLRESGSMLAMLWSDQPDFYGGLGFFRAGRERDFRFPKQLPTEGDTARSFDPDRDAEGLWECYRQHAGGLDRSPDELSRLCRIPRTQVFVTEREGKVSSYLVIHKGADFENYIHEWGGDISELSRNIAWVQSEHFPHAELTLIAPPFYPLEALERIAHTCWDGVLGLMKILSPDPLWKTYSSYVSALGAPRPARPASERETLETIFGTPEAIAPAPVLPFFLWGFDSV